MTETHRDRRLFSESKVAKPTTFEPVVANLTYSYINYASGVLATLCLVPLFARFLGHRLYGELVVITTLASSLSLANIGLDQALTNQVAYERINGGEARIQKLVSTALMTYAIAALIVTLLLAVGSAWLCRVFGAGTEETAPLALFALGALTMASLPWRTYGILLRGLGQVFEEQRIAAIFVIARIAASAILLFAGFKVLGIAIVQGLAVFGSAAAAYFRSRVIYKRTARISLFSVSILRSLAAPSLGFALLRLAGIVGFGIDSLVIGHALGPEQVTRYSVAFSLVVVCGTTIFSTFVQAILPSLSALYAQQNLTLLRRYLSLMVRLAILYVGTTATGFWIAGPWFLRLWAGRGVFPGSMTFALLIMLFAIQVLIDPFWAVLVSSTHHYGAAAMHTIESLLNLGLSIWWVRSFGLSGVIAGTLVARIATTGWFIPAVAVRIVDIDLNRAARHIIVPTLLSAATCSSFLWLVPIAADGLAVPLLALSGALIFAVIFTIFAFSRKERQAAIQYICGPNWLAEAVR